MEPTVYGLELGVDPDPQSWRVFAIDVTGFEHLEEAICFAQKARGVSARVVAHWARAASIEVGVVDASPEELNLPVAGATVYAYDKEYGTIWNQDLMSW